MPARLGRPDVLVLAAGGVLGEAWLRGLLCGAEAAGDLDFRRCEYFVGTSAGSIVAAALAAGRSPRGEVPVAGPDAAAAVTGAAARGREGRRDERAAGDEDDDGEGVGPLGGALREAAKWGAAVASPLAPAALAAGAPGGAVARAVALRSAPRPRRRLTRLHRQVAALGATFDGRLRIVAVDRRSGRRVVFGAPGEPRAEVTDAVLASCAVPWIFAPVEIGGREYVDGGVWSPTNIDAAPAMRGSDVLCLNPTGALDAARSPFGALRLLSQSAALAEAMALRARGARVRVVVPDRASARAMGADLMNASRSRGVLVAAMAQGRALAR